MCESETRHRNCVWEAIRSDVIFFYFRTVYVVIFILFKPTHALFLKHIHIHIWNTKLLKIFVKHIIKTLHISVTIVLPSSGGRLPCLVLLLLLCFFASSSCLFGLCLYVVYVCACLMCLSVGRLFVVSQPNIPQTSTSGTHTPRQHTATYQINKLTTHTSRELVTALSKEDGLLKVVKQLWPKHVGF